MRLCVLGLLCCLQLGSACDDRSIRSEHRELIAALPALPADTPCAESESALREKIRPALSLLTDVVRVRPRFEMPLSPGQQEQLLAVQLPNLAARYACLLRDPATSTNAILHLGSFVALLFDRAELEMARDVEAGWAWAEAGLSLYAEKRRIAYVHAYSVEYFVERATRLLDAHPPSAATKTAIAKVVERAKLRRDFVCAGFDEEDVETGGIEFAGRLSRSDRELMKSRWGAELSALLDNDDTLASSRPSLSVWRARRAFFAPLRAACSGDGLLAAAIAASQPALEHLRSLDAGIASMSEIARDRLVRPGTEEAAVAGLRAKLQTP